MRTQVTYDSQHCEFHVEFFGWGPLGEKKVSEVYLTNEEVYRLRRQLQQALVDSGEFGFKNEEVVA